MTITKTAKRKQRKTRYIKYILQLGSKFKWVSNLTNKNVLQMFRKLFRKNLTCIFSCEAHTFKYVHFIGFDVHFLHDNCMTELDSN